MYFTWADIADKKTKESFLLHHLYLLYFASSTGVASVVVIRIYSDKGVAKRALASTNE